MTAERSLNAKRVAIQTSSNDRMARIQQQLAERRTRDAQDISNAQMTAERNQFRKVAKQKDQEIETLRDELATTHNELKLAQMKIQENTNESQDPTTSRVQLKENRDADDTPPLLLTNPSRFLIP